jgi:signal peptidase
VGVVTLSLPSGVPSPRALLEGAGFVVLLAVVFLFVATAVPQLVGADRSFVVESDSMSPAIGAGSVVFVNDVDADDVAVGDVITFRAPATDENRVTHRVVAVRDSGGEPTFRTKGDANEDPDADPVPARDVVGAVGFHVPYIGYVLAFGGTGSGMLLLIGIPGAILVVLEVRDLLSSPADGGAGEDETAGEADAEVTDDRS